MEQGFNAVHTELEPLIGSITAFEPLAGGDSCRSYRLQTPKGRFFLKLSAESGAMLRCEAANLAALSASTRLRVPAVIAVGPRYLLLDYIEAGVIGADYWQLLAQGLAAMHSIEQRCFGFAFDNYCGRSVQLNPPTGDGYDFFSRYRLGFQSDLAARQGWLQTHHQRRVERLGQRLRELIPPQSPALLHGDLWSGNYFAASDGLPVMVDPACYHGWPEADLAMMTLFGDPPASFFDCYHQYAPLEPGWRQRFPIYNLYHLLNHLNLFGASYLPAVERILLRYG